MPPIQTPSTRESGGASFTLLPSTSQDTVNVAGHGQLITDAHATHANSIHSRRWWGELHPTSVNVAGHGQLISAAHATHANSIHSRKWRGELHPTSVNVVGHGQLITVAMPPIQTSSTRASGGA